VGIEQRTAASEEASDPDLGTGDGRFWYAEVEDARLSRAIVFVATPTGTRWPMAATDHTRNWGRYDGRVLFALDRGGDNVRLMDAYPDRASYRYAYDPVTSSGRLERLR